MRIQPSIRSRFLHLASELNHLPFGSSTKFGAAIISDTSKV